MKKLINEIARMQRIAGIITESEYQEVANVMDVAKAAHLEALKKELNSSNLDNWYISTTGNAYGIEITSTSDDQSQKFSTKHDDEGNVTDTQLDKIQPTSSNQKSLSITPAQKKEFLDRIKNIDSVNLEMDAANILAGVLTNDEAEFIEDVEDFGFDPDAVEDLAQKLVGIITETLMNEVSNDIKKLGNAIIKLGKQLQSVDEEDSKSVIEVGNTFINNGKKAGFKKYNNLDTALRDEIFEDLYDKFSIDLDEFNSNEEKEEKGPAIGPDGKIFVAFGERDGKKVWISPDSIGLGFVEVPEETTEDDIRKKYYSKNPAYASLI